MSRATLVALILAAAVAGCGADTEKTPTDFPPVKVDASGTAVAPVDDRAEADRLCDAAQADWPTAYAKYPYVTFDVPDTDSDFSCVRPG
jgi:predicted small lipoprotein YifL